VDRWTGKYNDEKAEKDTYMKISSDVKR